MCVCTCVRVCVYSRMCPSMCVFSVLCRTVASAPRDTAHVSHAFTVVAVVAAVLVVVVVLFPIPVSLVGSWVLKL